MNPLSHKHPECGPERERAFSLLRNVAVCLLFLFAFSGCLTIHNLNITSTPTASQEPVAIATVGNAGQPTSVPEPAPISEMGPLTTPPPPSLDSSSPAYTIHPGDELDVKFFYNPTLNETVKVRPDGRISLQLVQDVRAATLSPSELVTVLKNKYASYLKDPEISVIVRQFEASKVFVDGEVYKAGMVEMPGGYLTIMQAIARAQGLKDTARRDDVLLIRRNGLKRPFVYTVNLEAAMSGTDITQNIPLQPYDIVYVPKSTIANINTWVDQYIRRNIPINLNYDVYHLTE